MKVSVDRIEDGIAVLEVDTVNRIYVSVDKLPEGVKEGMLLSEQPDGSFKTELDETDKRREEMFRLQQMLNGK